MAEQTLDLRELLVGIVRDAQHKRTVPPLNDVERAAYHKIVLRSQAEVLRQLGPLIAAAINRMDAAQQMIFRLTLAVEQGPQVPNTEEFRRTGRTKALMLHAIARAMLMLGREVEFVDHEPHTEASAQAMAVRLRDVCENAGVPPMAVRHDEQYRIYLRRIDMDAPVSTTESTEDDDDGA